MKRAINILNLRKYLNINQIDFAMSLGLSQPYISEIENGKKEISEDIFNLIVEKFGEETVNPFIYNPYNNIINKGRSTVNYNSSSVGGNTINNHINISDLPESGYVKIIRPSGEIETYLSTSVYVDGTNDREKELFKQIIDLEKKVIERDAIIKSKDEMISMLRELLSHK